MSVAMMWSNCVFLAVSRTGHAKSLYVRSGQVRSRLVLAQPTHYCRKVWSLTSICRQHFLISEMCHPRCVYQLIGGGIMSITQQVYLMMFIRGWWKTTCFGLFRPSSGFHPKEYQCLQDLCGCVTVVISHHLWFLVITIIKKLMLTEDRHRWWIDNKLKSHIGLLQRKMDTYWALNPQSAQHPHYRTPPPHYAL